MFIKTKQITINRDSLRYSWSVKTRQGQYSERKNMKKLELELLDMRNGSFFL